MHVIIKKKLSIYKNVNSLKYCIGNNFIAKGVNGDVYNGKINNFHIAIKKQPLNSYEYNNIMITSDIHKTESWAEIFAMKLGNKLFLSNITPHVSLIYGYFICDDCKYENQELIKKSNNKCVYIINELANNNLYEWCLNNHSLEEWYIMLFQIIYTIYIWIIS